MKKYKEFREGTLYDKFKKCFEEGYRPLNISEAFEYRNKSTDGLWVSNYIINEKNKIIKSMDDVELIKSKNGFLWWVGYLGDYNYCGAFGYKYFDFLNYDNGRLVGVKIK